MTAMKTTFKQMKVKELNALSELLWAGLTFEEKSFAISLLDRFSKLLDDESWLIMSRWIEQAVG